MKVNLEHLKIEFKQYIAQKNREQKEFEDKNVQEQSSNIFLNNKDFKEFLVKEKRLDDSIFSMNINQVIDTLNENSDDNENEINENEDIAVSDEPDAEVFDAEAFVGDDEFLIQALNDAYNDEEVFKTLDADGSGELSDDEKAGFLYALNNENEELTFDKLSEGVQSIHDGKYLEFITNSMYSNSDVVEKLDMDNDGELSDIEKEKFEKYIANLDGNEELTAQDLKLAYESIKNNEFSTDDYEFVTDNKEWEEYASTAAEDKANSNLEKMRIQRNNNRYNRLYSKNTSPYSYSNSNFASNTSNINMKIITIDDLKIEKQEKLDKLNSVENETDKIYSKENENIKIAQENVDEAKEKYEEVLENDTEISQELKDKETDKLEEIDDKEEEIKATRDNISDLRNQITEKKSLITSDENKLSGYKQALSSLKSKETDDPEKLSEIESKISELEKAISELENKIKKEKEELEKLENNKVEQEKALQEQEQELQKLEDERKDIEKEILESECSEETKQALEDFQAAKENYETVKQEELIKIEALKTSLETEKTTLEKEISEIDEKIKEIEIRDAKKEYSLSNVEDVMKENGFDKGVLAGYGEYIEDVCEKYDIDPYLVLSIMAQETGYGTSNAIIKHNNPGGYMDSATGYSTVKHFNSLEEGIEAVVRNLSKNYIHKGLTSISAIGNKYCPVGAANDPTGLNQYWLGGVTNLYNEMKGGK